MREPQTSTTINVTQTVADNSGTAAGVHIEHATAGHGRRTRVAPLSPAARRALEEQYLGDLLTEYKVWAEKYTPLAGVATVTTQTDAPSLGLPDRFMPTSFEKLVEHGYGPERRANAWRWTICVRLSRSTSGWSCWASRGRENNDPVAAGV